MRHSQLHTRSECSTPTQLSGAQIALPDCSGKSCVDCGSEKNLEVDHLDPGSKASHRIWSWSEERREEELAKCVVRCRLCHLHKGREQGDLGQGPRRKHSFRVVEEVRRRYAAGGVTQRQLAEEYGTTQSRVSRWVRGSCRLNR